jgi:hypothetical protein
MVALLRARDHMTFLTHFAVHNIPALDEHSQVNTYLQNLAARMLLSRMWKYTPRSMPVSSTCCA